MTNPDPANTLWLLAGARAYLFVHDRHAYVTAVDLAIGEIERLRVEITRLNEWADGFSDCQLEERRTGEALIAELLAELADALIAELLAELADAHKWRALAGCNSFEEMHAAIGDSERLDWLEAHAYNIEHVEQEEGEMQPCLYYWDINENPDSWADTLREAIDKARAGEDGE